MPISAEAKEDLKEMDLLPRKHIMADHSGAYKNNSRVSKNSVILKYRQIILLSLQGSGILAAVLY